MKRNRTISQILVPIAGAVILTTASNAAVLAQYNFTGSVNTTSDVDVNSTASGLGIGAAGDEFGSDHGFSILNTITNQSGAAATIPVRFVRGNVTTATAVGAFANNDYFKFTLTPNATFLTNLTSLFFDYAANGPSNANPNTATFFVRSPTVNNSTTNVGTPVEATQGGGNFIYRRHTIDLSGAIFQNLTSSIEFRIYVMNSITATNEGIARLDNITLNGAIAPIPEPSSLALVGSLGVLALLRRRRA